MAKASGSRNHVGRSYRGIIENHIAPAIGGAQLAKLAPNHVQGMYAKLESDGASAYTRRLVHAVLHRALKQALRWGMIGRNPVDAVDAPRAPKKEAACFTLEQSKAILEAAKGNHGWKRCTFSPSPRECGWANCWGSNGMPWT